jgi:hypothetical protein
VLAPLLFHDDVFREFYKRRGRDVDGASCVDRLTWAESDRAIARVGFRMESLDFSGSEFADAFYRRFEDILGRYPRWDLTRDFIRMVLRKPDWRRWASGHQRSAEIGWER